MSATMLAQQSRPSICNADPRPAALDIVLRNLAGADVPLSTFRGKILLLNFWATWCVPCKIEIPALNELQEKYRRRGVAIVGVNVGESADLVGPYSQSMKIGYTNLLSGDRSEVLKAFNVDVGLPTTIIIGRDGITCRRRVGLTRKDTFEQLIRALL